MDDNINIDIATYQEAVEVELDNLRRENFSLKVVIAQLKKNNQATDVAKQSADLPMPSPFDTSLPAD